jgi:hypothetical protein
VIAEEISIFKIDFERGRTHVGLPLMQTNILAPAVSRGSDVEATYLQKAERERKK